MLIPLSLLCYGDQIIYQALLVLYTCAVLNAANNAITAIRKARFETKSSSRKRKVKDEVSFLFNKKKAKGTVWKHRFVCLAYRDQYKIPTSDTDKDDLLKAGLGEKVIEFDDLDIDADDFRQVILDAYPQLKNAGGFTFFKCAPNSRSLEPLSQIVLSSPRLLKERVGTARTYVRPVQRDMDLSAVFQLPKGVRIQCATFPYC